MSTTASPSSPPQDSCALDSSACRRNRRSWRSRRSRRRFRVHRRRSRSSAHGVEHALTLRPFQSALADWQMYTHGTHWPRQHRIGHVRAIEEPVGQEFESDIAKYSSDAEPLLFGGLMTSASTRCWSVFKTAVVIAMFVVSHLTLQAAQEAPITGDAALKHPAGQLAVRAAELITAGKIDEAMALRTKEAISIGSNLPPTSGRTPARTSER